MATGDKKDGLEDLRLEQFCSQFAFGVPIPAGLKAAGYEVHTVSFGYALLRDPKALALVDEHRDWIRKSLSFTLEQVAQQLDRDREFAYLNENPAAAVAATMNKAKLLGFMDKQSDKVPRKITVEWGDDSNAVSHDLPIPGINGQGLGIGGIADA